jgi:hypothetical protein
MVLASIDWGLARCPVALATIQEALMTNDTIFAARIEYDALYAAITVVVGAAAPLGRPRTPLVIT